MATNPTRAYASVEERRAAETASLHRVQRRVGAIAFFTVTVHGVLGVIGAAYVREDQGRHADAIGLVVMSGVIAVIVYTVTRTILGAKLWSPAWIALALTPTLAAVIWIL